MFLLREVRKTDFRSLKRLAVMLNTVNLPDDEKLLKALIAKSTRSFAGRIPSERRTYVFVLEDLKRKIIAGTSMIIAQHGNFEAPHTYYAVSEREHYSATLDRHFRHRVLSIGYNYSGPTEIGGLVVDPPYRHHPEKVGKQLSYVRFLFIAMHRPTFRNTVLAELLPPLLSDGRSLLWEAIGKKFTGLTYQEADQLSQQNKEFIKELFPSSDIYASLFPKRTQRVIGEVGPESKSVQYMLGRIGFRYVERVDPFDGGPHYEARVDDVSLVRQFQTAKLSSEALKSSEQDLMVGIESKRGFRAIRTLARAERGAIHLSQESAAALEARPGAILSLIPFT